MQCKRFFVIRFPNILILWFLCFLVAMCDLSNIVETMLGLCYLLSASGNYFWNMLFLWLHSYFRNNIDMLLAVSAGK